MGGGREWDGHRGSLVLEFPAQVGGVQSCPGEGAVVDQKEALGLLG